MVPDLAQPFLHGMPVNRAYRYVPVRGRVAGHPAFLTVVAASVLNPELGYILEVSI